MNRKTAGILGAAGGFLTGGPVGAIRGAAGAVGEQDILEAGPRGLTDKELAALHNRDARLLAAGGRSDVAIRSRLTEPVTSPGMAMIPMGGPLGMAVLRGYRLNRSTYVTRGGGTSRWPMALVVHPKHTEQVRVRRMNVANPRAQVITAAGEGSAAAIAINADLVAASVDRRDFVAEPDRAADEDVGTQPAAVDERTEETRSRQLLEVSAWLSEAASDAFDAADPKATADKRIE